MLKVQVIFTRGIHMHQGNNLGNSLHSVGWKEQTERQKNAEQQNLIETDRKVIAQSKGTSFLVARTTISSSLSFRLQDLETLSHSRLFCYSVIHILFVPPFFLAYVCIYVFIHTHTHIYVAISRH